jgi:hypothetical protein
MENTEKVAGGLFVVVLMLLLATPLNDEIQGLAMAAGASDVVRAVAVFFPVFWIGLMFIVLAFSGYEAIQSMGS